MHGQSIREGRVTTITQLPLLTRSHNNHQLFSDHYLDAALPTRPE